MVAEVKDDKVTKYQGFEVIGILKEIFPEEYSDLTDEELEGISED